MRRTTIPALSAAALLALTACEIPEEESGDVEALEERISTLEESAADLQEKVSDQNATINELRGDVPESDDSDDVEEVADDDTEATEDVEPDAEEEDEVNNASGGLTGVGEPAPLRDEFTGVEVGTITLNEIERNFMHPECEEWGDTPDSGEFVALHLTIDIDSDVDEPAYVWEDAFYLVDEGDTMHRNAIHTGAAWSCAISAGAIEATQPGTNTSGVVLLDTTIESGTLGFDGGGSSVLWDF